MGWLDTLQRRGEQARGEPEPVRQIVSAPRPQPEIKSVFVETRRPYGPGDTGAGVAVFYSVQDGVLTIRDEGGKPKKTYFLKDGEDPRHAAHRIGRSSLIDADPIGFNRPLNLPPLSIA